MRWIAIIAAGLALAGCMPDRAELERGLRVQAENQKAQAERRAHESERQKEAWQAAATVSVAGAALLLVLGAALGSRSRRDARRP